MEQRFDTPGQVALSFEVSNGDIVVRATDTSTTSVEISGFDSTRPPRVTCDADPSGGHRVSIEYRAKKTWGFSFGRGPTIEVSVPTGTALEGSSGAADLETLGTFRSMTLRTGSGDIHFDDVLGDARIASASGDVVGRSVGGHLVIKGASGDLEIGDVGNGATVRSASGDIEIRRLGGSSTIVAASGDVALRDVGPGDLNVRAISGDVGVAVQRGMGVLLDVSSTSGDIRSALDPAERGAPQDRPDLDLTVTTVSGDVEIRRASGQD
jgi:hypothetical protein